MEFAEWYSQEHPGVLAVVVMAAGDFEVARDITAEAFARAFERWDRVGHMESPAGWTCRVALNLVRRRHRQAVLARRAADRTPPPLLLLLDDERVAVWEAVRRLPERARLAVALRYLAGLTESEVADAMGIATGTASATLHSARRRLAELMADEPETDISTSGTRHG